VALTTLPDFSCYAGRNTNRNGAGKNQMAQDSNELLNIGPKSTKWLNAIGINTLADLEAIGAVAAYSLIKAQGYNASLNLLYALHGALTGQRWNELSAETKRRLQEEAAGFRFVD
jgi:DNA transformation protein